MERETKVFKETDTAVKLYDFDKMRLLVSDPVKKMCLKQKIQDISPVSMVPREHDQIIINNAYQAIWAAPASKDRPGADDDDSGWYEDAQDENAQVVGKTTYLGQHKVALRSTAKSLLDSEYYHIFTNNYNFLDLEEKFAERGGAMGTTTLYLWRAIEKEDMQGGNEQGRKDINWQLAGVATKYLNKKPDIYANLGTSFKRLEPTTLSTSEY